MIPCLSFDPRGSEIASWLIEKSTNPLNDVPVVLGFDKIIGEHAVTVLIVSDDADLLPSRCRRDQ